LTVAAIQRRATDARRAIGASPTLQTVVTAILLALIAITLFLVLGWNAPTSSRVQIAPGQVAPFDIVAPRQITYVSDLLTEQARQRAAAAIPEQYDIAAGSIRRQQVVQSREIASVIEGIRDDPALSEAARLDALLAIPELGLTAEAAVDILALSSADWQESAQELPAALDRLLRDEIRQTDLPAVQRRVPSIVSADLSEAAAESTAALVRALARPNSFPNPDRTNELREAAREAIAPLSVTIERGEIILRAGDVATPEDVEALQQIGLVSTEWERWTLLRALAYTVIILALATGAWIRFDMPARPPLRQLGILTLLVVTWLVAAKFMIVPHDWFPLIYPLAALTMLIACLINVRVAVIVSLAMALVVHWLGTGNSMLVVYSLAGGLAGALVLGRAERLSVFIWAALAVILANLLAIIAFRLPLDAMSTSERLQLLLAAPLNGGLSASIALLGYFALGNLFGLTTSLQLNELSRPTHPLLRQLLLKASGTYHHSIVVSNLAERAAAAIGADALLARVGAYYHDIGKTVRPYFFSENNDEDASPHDRLDPQTSAQIIISHVRDGVDLAQKYRLPRRLQDFILEHHGRSLVQYFYVRAIRDAGSVDDVDEELFRYPGPRPRSRETAILALADTCEAAVRAMRPASREELATLVNRLIDERIAEGEIDESPLTYSDVQAIREVFVQVLQGVHHPRVIYPDADGAPTKPSAAAVAAAPPADSASAIQAERNAVQGTLVTDQTRPPGVAAGDGPLPAAADSVTAEPNGSGRAGAEEFSESAAMASVDKAG
jgi:putative nucleotidyltransferase with HDIG domain